MSGPVPGRLRRLLDRAVPPEVWTEKRWIGWLLLASVILLALFALLSLATLILLIDSLARHGAGTLEGQAGFEPGGPQDFGQGIRLARWWLVGLWMVVPLSIFRLWWHFGRGEGPRSGHRDLEAAQRGDPEAAHRLALHYRTRDSTSARAWLVRAAHGGHPAAMVDLALELRDGHGGPRDLPSAQGWLRRAATAGEPRAFPLLAEIEARIRDRHSELEP